jgi:hypothetical protein
MDQRYRLEVGAVLSCGQEPDPLRLRGQVIRSSDVALGTRLSSQHRVVGEDVEPGHEVSGRDLGRCGRGPVLEWPLALAGERRGIGCRRCGLGGASARGARPEGDEGEQRQQFASHAVLRRMDRGTYRREAKLTSSDEPVGRGPRKRAAERLVCRPAVHIILSGELGFSSLRRSWLELGS